jgi:hypothetical protein
MSMMRWTVRLCAISAAGSSAAWAEGIDEPAEQPMAARAPAADDTFTPGLTHAAGHGRGFATGVAQYNGASKTTTVDLNGEVQVFGPVRLVLRVDNVFNKARPGIGAAVQWLDERKHGVSSSAYFSYKAEGFTEAEGELEGLVSFGKQLGSVRGTLNLAYGQDPEGRERDGEAALGLHIEPIRGLFTGVVGRYRDALGSNGDKATGVLRDALGGASATYVLGNFGVTATAGFAGIKTLTSGSMQTGAEAALSVGAVF